MHWKTWAFVCTVLFSGCSENAPAPVPREIPNAQTGKARHDHGGTGEQVHHSALVIQMQPAAPQAGQPVVLNMMVHDPAGKMVSSFEVIHEKKAHLIIVREGLDHFAHIHPEVDRDGNFTTKFEFPVGGKYHLFLDHKPTGKEEAVAMAEVQVAGDTPQPALLSANVPGVITADHTVAKISTENVKPKEAATIKFQLSDSSGKPVTDLEPYLGAMGHLVVISADATEYVHAHPLDARAPPGEVNFMAHFAKPGLYKGWGQFQRSGTVRTIPFVIAVK